jgi:hypothetical protein
MNRLLPLVCCLALIFAGCAAFKQTARTINDAARIACEVAFGEELPQGVSVKDFCAVHENLHPFVDQILAAKAGVKAGMAKPTSDE